MTRLPLLAAALALFAAGCGGFASHGCGLDPQSEPLALGESAVVQVEVVDSPYGRRVRSVDVNGGYYVQPDRRVRVPNGGHAGAPSPSIAAPAGTRAGTATRTAAGVELQLGEQRFLLSGPIGCD